MDQERCYINNQIYTLCPKKLPKSAKRKLATSIFKLFNGCSMKLIKFKQPLKSTIRFYPYRSD